MKLLFVRHGETDHNLEHRIQGHRDTPLNSRGEEQAREIAEIIHKREKIDAVFCSDLRRASRTAEIISQSKLPLHALSSLRERHMGEIEGMLHKDAVKKRDLDEKRSLLEYGENEQVLTARLLKAYEEVCAEALECNYKTVIVVSHGSALNHLFQGLLKTRRISFAHPEARATYNQRPKLGNCSVTIIEDHKLVDIALQWTKSIVRERDLV